MFSTSVRMTRRGAIAATLFASMGVRSAFARQATPQAPDGFRQRASTLLEMLPPRTMPERGGVAFYYADLEHQLALTGVPRPAPSDVPNELPAGFVEATYALPLASRAFQSAMDSEWMETFGFNPYAAGQTLDVTDDEALVSVVRGGFDRAEVEAALEANGFDLILQETGGAFWSFGDEIDFESPVGRLGVGAMNQAIVDDDVLIFSREFAIIQQVTQVRAGLQPSAWDAGPWAEVIEHFSDDLVGLVPVDPAGLLIPPDLLGAATPVATPVPDELDLVMMAFGVRAGSVSEPIALGGEGTPVATPQPVLDPEPAKVELRLRYLDSDVAAGEAEAIPSRWRTMDSLITGERFNDRLRRGGQRLGRLLLCAVGRILA